ncbi:DNA-processing protein DprA [Paraburkholderia dilworthii]|uniref:DNA-processing protein DprA n=1 Tax=Paraburkholderia dilworthii TaxID=948106 RepID=UPI000405D4C6|nr:DNA-processing protein DprA [Paraburkholderia dilworthii]
MHTLPATHLEVAAWLRLSLAPGLKPAALRVLLTAFGLPEAILQQDHETLAAVAGDAAARATLAPASPEFDAQLGAVIAWRELPGNHLVTLDDPAYPPALLTMPDPPPLLYIKGRLDLLHTRAVALVGSRSATPQGMEDAERFARTLSTAGVTVVSGLAQGIDGAAHRGGLEGAGSTVAVIGTGADLVYPAAHHALARQIAVQGAILSEWPLGTPARAANFPQRNRLIAGLVSGVLIVEAAMRSGSLITARLANEMGRDIFALPGSIHAPLSRGCHRMLKQGAKLVETPEEVLEELGFSKAAPAVAGAGREKASTQASLVTAAGSAAMGSAQREESTQAAAGEGTFNVVGSPGPDAARLLAALGYSPTPLEILATRTEMDYAVLQTTLLQLELAGHVSALPGGRYTRASHG